MAKLPARPLSRALSAEDGRRSTCSFLLGSEFPKVTNNTAANTGGPINPAIATMQVALAQPFSNLCDNRLPAAY